MSADICFQWLIKDICNMRRFIFHIDRIPMYLKNNRECDKWQLQWAMLLSFLNDLLLPSDKQSDTIKRLMNFIGLFESQYPILREIRPAARKAQASLIEWNQTIMTRYLDLARGRAHAGQIAFLKATKLDTIDIVKAPAPGGSPDANVPDFDILAIVGGPVVECRLRLDMMIQYLAQVDAAIGRNAMDGNKMRHIIISGRGGHSLKNDLRKENWTNDEGEPIEQKTEAELLLAHVRIMFTEARFPRLFQKCKISVDTAALDTVGNAVMIKYLSLQANFLPGGSRKKTFEKTTIVSVSNIYHVNRLLYLMKNFMPRGTHYGLIGGSQEEADLIDDADKVKGSADSTLQAYNQSFTRDVGYILPIFTKKCLNNDGSVGPQINETLDLGLFEFLMHHGLYHRTSSINKELEGAGRQGEIWNSGMTSRELVQYMGNFCLPFSSLDKRWDINNILDTKIFKENCNLAHAILGDLYESLYTFSRQRCGGGVALGGPGGGEHKHGGRRRKRRKRTRKKRKKKRNRSQKK